MSGLGPLHFTGKVDRQEEMLILNQQKEQAVLKTFRCMHPVPEYGEVKGESSDLERYMLSGPKTISANFSYEPL